MNSNLLPEILIVFLQGVGSWGEAQRNFGIWSVRRITIAADASLIHTIAWLMHENGKALRKLTDNEGVILHETPQDYFKEYSAATKKLYDKFNASNPFFKKVFKSMERFAKVTVPFWAQAQRSNAEIGAAFAGQQEKNEN